MSGKLRRMVLVAAKILFVSLSILFIGSQIIIYCKIFFLMLAYYPKCPKNRFKINYAEILNIFR